MVHEHTFDATGNTVQRGAETFGYDQANRLRSSTLGAVSYAYNGDGVRVSSSVGALTTRFVSDVNGSLPVVLTESGPTGTRKYVYGAGGLAYVDEGLVTGLRVMHTDGLGSVRALTDSRGWVVQTYQTDEFGVPEPLSSLGASTQPRQYTGEQRDQETGFVYLRARLYDPQLGRFIQADPLRKSGPSIGGWNRYTYVGNNPIGRVDPSGLVDVDCTVEVQGSYLGGGIIGARSVQTCIGFIAYQRTELRLVQCRLLLFGGCFFRQTVETLRDSEFCTRSGPGRLYCPSILRFAYSEPLAPGSYRVEAYPIAVTSSLEGGVVFLLPGRTGVITVPREGPPFDQDATLSEDAEGETTAAGVARTGETPTRFPPPKSAILR